MKKEKVHLDWTWVADRLNVIGEQIEKYGPDKIDKVSGIPRGGLIPAVMLSHSFGIPFINLYAAKELSKNDRARILVLDDICDSGFTIKQIEKYGFLTAALTTKSGSGITPTFSGDVISTDDWLVFPWENINSNSIQDYLVESK